MAKLKDDKISMTLDLQAQEAEATIHRLTKATEELRKQNTEYRKEISRKAAAEGISAEETKRLNDLISANNKEIEANKKAIEEQRAKIDYSRMSAADLGRELKNLKRQLANTSKATNPQRYRDLEDKISKVEKAYASATRSTRGFITSMLSLDKIATTIKGFFMGLGMVIMSQVVGAFKKLNETIIDFERANSRLAAVLGTSIEGVEKLTEQAKYLGRTTTATASQVTGLQTELAKLGFSQEVIEKLTPAALKFAKAVDTDLSSAAAFAGAAMRIFNKDAGEAESLMATFAVATTKSALDFHKLEQSLASVGPVANSFGFSVEETTALLGVLSNAGFDASSAATATRNILLNLCDANGELAQALGGPVKNLDDLVAGLNKLNSEGVDLAKVLELTDKRSVAAFSSFLKGSDSLLELRDAITGATSDFNAMSSTMADNAAAAQAGFSSAIEGLILKFYDWREGLKSLYEIGTVAVTWIGDFIDALQPAVDVVKALLMPVGAAAVALGKFVGWLEDVITKSTVGRRILNAVVVALISLKVASLASTSAMKKLWASVVLNTKATGTYLKSLLLKAKALYADAQSTGRAVIAQRALNLAMKSNPIILLIGLIATLVTAFMDYGDAAGDAAEATDAWTESNKEASRQYGEQKGKIEALIMVANNETLSLNRRKKAIQELNRIIPGYNAKIDETTGKYTASKAALDAYLESLDKELRYKANESKMQELAAAAEAARDAYDEMAISAAQGPKRVKRWYGTVYVNQAAKDAKKLKEAWDQAEADYAGFKSRMEKAMESGVITPPATGETAVEDELKNTNAAAAETVTRLKEINAELKNLRKMDPQSDEELDRIRRRIEALQEEKRLLMGKQSRKRTPGTYGADSLAEATASVDDAHQRRLLKINKSDDTAIDKTIAKNRELIQYCAELDQALENLRANTDKTHTATLDKITTEQNKIAQQAVNAQREINSALAQKDAEAHDQRLAEIEVFNQHQNDLMKAAVAAEQVTQEAADIYRLENDRKSHRDRLVELQDYYNKVAAADYLGAEERQKLLKKVGAEIRKAQSSILTDSATFAEKIRELSTNSESIEGVRAAIDLQIQSLEQTYEAVINMAREQGLDITRLEEEKQRRIAALNYRYLEEQYKTQETVGLTWTNEYDRELAKLQNMHRQGLISERDFQKARLNLQKGNVQKYYEYYSQMAASMVSAIQEAEIAKSEAKYDVLIQQAKNAGDDTAALEQEKENKKLAIQKKYADLDFAVKISQIIANTAVAIMQAFAQLGPIGGAIAAAMLTATGAVQLATAKAERDKVKNLQPGNVAGSATQQPATATRALTGYSEGGYTGAGGRYEVAGVVHRGEYVVPKPIMGDPRVIDAVGMIEAIRQNKRLASGGVPSYAQGYAEGGFTGAPEVDRTASLEIAAAVKELRKAAEALRNVRAYVVYRDLEKAGQTLDAARAPFTR